MDIKLFFTVFFTIFAAELGDKTQIATLLYASNSENPKGTVFIASSMALILSSALGVLLGSFVSHYLTQKWISWGAGIGFIAVGLWTIIRA